jgi:regulator of cell morphogenesis and NO signaling
MNNLKNITIGEIVAKDYRAAAVFKSFGIDFCCKGQRTIEEACSTKKADPEEVISKLQEILSENRSESFDYNSWPIDLLADYIEKKHHRFVRERIPMLLQFLDKLCKVHGDQHPELFKIKVLFSQSAEELISHMEREELIVFPYVRKMVKTPDGHRKFDAPHFDSVRNPILNMMAEHEAEGSRFEQIKQLANGYNPPEDACNTYRVTYAFLHEFENDLHKHIHLENNILFPKAVASEKQEVFTA